MSSVVLLAVSLSTSAAAADGGEERAVDNTGTALVAGFSSAIGGSVAAAFAIGVAAERINNNSGLAAKLIIPAVTIAGMSAGAALGAAVAGGDRVSVVVAAGGAAAGGVTGGIAGGLVGASVGYVAGAAPNVDDLTAFAWGTVIGGGTGALALGSALGAAGATVRNPNALDEI